MIQFKKIPPSKSAILLLLFLTTNSYGFLRDNQNDPKASRKTHNLFVLDLQQEVTQNMPIRRVGIDRVINQKDENPERLYDRRSFRTGTIQDRSERSGDVIRDLNNNFDRFSRNLRERTPYTREFDNTNARETRQRLAEDRNDYRSGERAVISRQYEARTTSERETGRRVIRETSTEARSLYSREEADRVVKRQLPQRRLAHEESFRRVENQLEREPNENRRFVRSETRSFDEIRSRRISPEERVTNQIRGFTERLESKGIRGRRLLQNSDTRISARRNEDQRRMSSEERLVFERRNEDQRRVSTEERSTRRLGSRETVLQRRVSEDRDTRLAERRNEAQRRLSTDSRETSRQRRVLENRDGRIRRSSNTPQRRILDDTRLAERRSKEDQIRLFTERLERLGSRSNQMQIRSSTERFDQRRTIRENPMEGNSNQRRSLSENRSFSRTLTRVNPKDVLERRSVERRSSTERLERRTDGRIMNIQNPLSSEQRNSLQRRSFTERLEKVTSRQNRLEERVPSRALQERIDSSRILLEKRDATQASRYQTRVDRRFSRLFERKDNMERVVNFQGSQEEKSRSDSTRYIRDNTRFDSVNRDIRLSRLDERGSIRVAAEEKMTRDMDAPTLKEKSIEVYTLANTVKVILAVFLMCQIFVNSSKANKFRFHNIMTTFKEKIH